MDPLLSELGQPLPLSEEQLEEVRGETSTALYVPQTQLLRPVHTHIHTSDYMAKIQRHHTKDVQMLQSGL